MRARVGAAGAVLEPGEALVIDLRQVRFMDSPGLGTIVFCDRTQREQGGHLVLKDATGAVRDLFDVVQLGKVIELE